MSSSGMRRLQASLVGAWLRFWMLSGAASEGLHRLNGDCNSGHSVCSQRRQSVAWSLDECVGEADVSFFACILVWRASRSGRGSGTLASLPDGALEAAGGSKSASVSRHGKRPLILEGAEDETQQMLPRCCRSCRR
jgi:hypothetical protein